MRRSKRDRYSMSLPRETVIRIKTATVAFGATLLAWFAIAETIAAWQPSDEAVAAGRELFEHEWTPNDPLAGGGDGLGPVFNAKSCVACHFQGGVGGGGTSDHNVVSFEALPTKERTEIRAGVVHAAAVSPELLESPASLTEMFPTIRVSFDNGCGTSTKVLTPLRMASVNSPSLFGAGQIDRISDGAIRRNHHYHLLSNVADDFQMDFDAPRVGRVRELPDGRVGKFGWKAQFATVEEFVAAACAVEVGLTNPLRSQDAPGQHVPDTEAAQDINGEQFYALVSFVGTLPKPEQRLPENVDAATVQQGERLFAEIGCAHCHTPNLGGVKGLYSDLLLHVVETGAGGKGSYGEDFDLKDSIPDDHPKSNEWKTPPLWGVADTAPYFHDGNAQTLEDAILRHQGDAKGVTQRYEHMKPSEREQIVAFLKSLRAPSSAASVTSPATIESPEQDDIVAAQ